MSTETQPSECPFDLDVAYKTITQVLSDRYGVGIYSNPTHVLWAAEIIFWQHGKETATKQLKAINAKRNKMGCIPVYVDYGSPLF